MEGSEEENNSGTVLWKNNHEHGASESQLHAKGFEEPFSEVSRLLCSSAVGVLLCCSLHVSHDLAFCHSPRAPELEHAWQGTFQVSILLQFITSLYYILLLCLQARLAGVV